MSVQSIPDLICIVSTELPVDTTTEFVEAMDIKKKITSSVLEIANLVGTAFIYTNGNIYKAVGK